VGSTCSALAGATGFRHHRSGRVSVPSERHGGSRGCAEARACRLSTAVSSRRVAGSFPRCTACYRGAGNGTEAGSKIGLVSFLGVDGLPLTGKPGSGGGILTTTVHSSVHSARSRRFGGNDTGPIAADERTMVAPESFSRTLWAGSQARPLRLGREGIQKAVDKPPVAGRSWQR
jgi:hypothetical protein